MCFSNLSEFRGASDLTPYVGGSVRLCESLVRIVSLHNWTLKQIAPELRAKPILGQSEGYMAACLTISRAIACEIESQ